MAYTLDWQIEQDLKDTMGMTEEDRAKFMIASLNSHFLQKNPQQLPQEDSREIIVKTRRGGKSTELYEKAYAKLRVGLKVLFVSHNRLAAKMHFEDFKYALHVKGLGKDFITTNLNISLLGATIDFIGIEDYKLRTFFDMTYDYKIMDDALSEFYEFDLVSINGVISK